MGNKSRARKRLDQPTPAPIDPDDAERNAALEVAQAAYESGDKKGSLGKMVDLILRDRKKALAHDEPVEDPIDALVASVARSGGTAVRLPDAEPIGLREPSAFEAAILSGLGSRVAAVGALMGAPTYWPVEVVSGGMYGGTVEPARVAARRRRNKAARRARHGRPPVHTGRVYQSRFGYAHNHDPLGRIGQVVDAEVVDE